MSQFNTFAAALLAAALVSLPVASHAADARPADIPTRAFAQLPFGAQMKLSPDGSIMSGIPFGYSKSSAGVPGSTTKKPLFLSLMITSPLGKYG